LTLQAIVIIDYYLLTFSKKLICMKKLSNKTLSGQAGFTLIELLVVIAIIGILASVILASLDSARAKGTDAAMKSDLANALPQAELYYDAQSPTAYTGLCTAATSANGVNGMIVDAASKGGYGTPVTAASTAGTSTTVVCHDSASAWAASIPLKSIASTYFCVDSTGATKQDASPLPASTYICP
jgi:prepilin-type N-terminal cleavage/methylation domain-containing protein